jgi:hypothetical protein
MISIGCGGDHAFSERCRFVVKNQVFIIKGKAQKRKSLKGLSQLLVVDVAYTVTITITTQSKNGIG